MGPQSLQAHKKDIANPWALFGLKPTPKALKQYKQANQSIKTSL